MSPGPVFLLTDYGTVDEFAGVLRAVLEREAPGVTVVDLTHEVPSFDVAGGAESLWRAAPHLGPGVVLAVVDPGVGSARRAVALAVEPRPGAEAAGPAAWVGPDNGLLLPGAEAVGTVVAASALERPPGDATTFDGRDVFAPAAAALASGRGVGELGPPVDPSSLQRLAPHPVVLSGDARRGTLRAPVTWVDRFGNVQLAAGPEQLPPSPARFLVTVPGAQHPARPVTSFSALAQRELGLVVDANGRLALALRRASAATYLGLAAGDEVEVSWG